MRPSHKFYYIITYFDRIIKRKVGRNADFIKNKYFLWKTIVFLHFFIMKAKESFYKKRGETNRYFASLLKAYSSTSHDSFPPQGNNTNTEVNSDFVLFFFNDFFGIRINKWIHTLHIAWRIRSLGFFITIFYYSIFLPFVLVVVAQ